MSVDDPHSLDFVELRDIHGATMPLDSEEGAATAVRRTTLAARLRALYGDIEKLDAFTGMVSERHVLGTEFGELQLAIWKQQFQALRDGDRFYYLNDPALALIERDYGISARHTLAQVIEANSEVDVRDDVFKLDGAPGYEPADGGLGGTVAATLSLSLGAAANFGAFAAGVAREYVANSTVNVISTAGDALLSVADPSTAHPGHLVNGASPSPRRCRPTGPRWGARRHCAPGPDPRATTRSRSQFKQPIAAGDALRSGSYSKLAHVHVVDDVALSPTPRGVTSPRAVPPTNVNCAGKGGG